MAKLFDTTSFRITEQGLNVLNQQSKIIAQNITNQDTPDYKCKYLYFEGILRDKLNTTSKFKKELTLGTAVYVDKITKDQPDGNNVDYDTQAALYEKNRIQYDALINQMNGEFDLLRSAMRKT